MVKIIIIINIIIINIIIFIEVLLSFLYYYILDFSLVLFYLPSFKFE